MTDRGRRRNPARASAVALLAVLVTGLLPSGVAHPLATPGTAAAQNAPSCPAEVEPNDTPESGPSLAGPVCQAGTLADGDQDLLVWEISAADAETRWVFRLDGVAGTLTGLKLFPVASAPTEVPIIAGNVLLDVSSGPAGPDTVTRDGLLLPAGRYIVGISRSALPDGGSPADVAYRYAIERGPAPTASREAEPNDDGPAGNPVSGAFAMAGDLGAGPAGGSGSYDWFAWTVPGGIRWDLHAETQMGASLWLEVQAPDGTTLDSISSQTTADLYDLALPAGTWWVRIAPGADAQRPYLVTASPSSEKGDAEPNDDRARALPMAEEAPARGRLARDGDRDVYLLRVPAGREQLRNARLLWRSGVERRLCLLDADVAVACRAGTSGVALDDLYLPPGDHFLEVSGASDPHDVYLLRIDGTSAPAPDFETEPNNEASQATRWDPSITMRGRSVVYEDDWFRLQVGGEPQLWQVDGSGKGMDRLQWVQPDGTALAVGARDGGEVATLTDLYLYPGEHWFRIDGPDGEYRIAATPLGPPDPDRELEPNNEEVLAEPYAIGERRVGRLATIRDSDVFRFTLTTPEHVGLRLVPPDDGAVRIWLESGAQRVADIRSRETGAWIDLDLLLQPGDHVLWLSPDQPSRGSYTLTSERLDPFDLADDQEPDDDTASARPLPSDLRIRGTAQGPGEDDWYALPVFATPADLRVRIEGADTVVRISDGTDQLDVELQEDGSWLAPSLPAGVPLYLWIASWGDYVAEVSSDALVAVPRPVAPPVEVTLTSPVEAAAAYWPDSQRLPAELTIVNAGTIDQHLALEARASHHLWTALPRSASVDVPAGATVSVPVDVEVAPDAWSDGPVRVTLRASAPDGAGVSAALEVALDPDATPVDPHPGWTVPEDLLGGVNVASLGLGAVPGGTQDAERERTLFDGVTPAGAGFGAQIDALPVELTVDLAGDAPVPVAGTIINPQAGIGYIAETPRDFELLLSTDGTAWETVLRGRLSPLPIDQAFVLEAPVEARQAMLRITAMQSPRTSYVSLGEWKVIAAPGSAAVAGPLDLASTALGGHLVVRAPANSDLHLGDRMLDEDPGQDSLYLEQGDTADLVLGFADGRAAQISHLEWVDSSPSDPQQRLAAVDVAISPDGPSGPWRSLGSWTLGRAADGSVPAFAFPAATWARFVRLTGLPPAEARTLELPATIRAWERPQDAGYRSILGEWGYASPRGPYEWSQALADGPVAEGPDAGDSAGEASPLAAGVTVADRATINQDADWYRLQVPAGHNSLEIVVTGRPTVGVQLWLQDSAGAAAPMAFAPTETGAVRYQAAVKPGQAYRLRVEQPPFSAVFAFDTSGSMGAYLAFVRQALRAYTTDVEPGREVVHVLPFEEKPLLDGWSDQPYALQDAVGRYVVGAGSSGAEAALIDASELLAEREGARAVLLVTDAETSTFDRTGELWSTLESVRPVVFSVHVGATSEPVVSRHLMQDWALSSGGQYQYARSHGEMDRAFERMATWLRRPATYTLTYSTSEVVLEPGRLRVSAPQDGSRPGVAPNVGVELILDTSGSMLDRLEGRRRIEIARDALQALVGEVLPEGLPVALRTFGAGKDRCGTTLTVPLAPLDRAAVLERLAGLKALKKTNTPLAAALLAVADDLALVTGPRTIVLVTDGLETCKGDPTAAVEALAAAGVDVHVNIVGFALDDPDIKEQMRAWAALGNGSYFDAAGADTLAEAIAVAVSAPFRIYDPDSVAIASGTVGGEPVSLDPGTYRIEVLTDPPVVFREVVVGSGATVDLVLDSAEPVEPGQASRSPAP